MRPLRMATMGKDDQVTSSGAGDYDLSHLPPDVRAEIEADIQRAIDAGNVFTDRDVTPGDTGTAEAN